MNQALNAYLSNVGLLASCLTHTLRGEPFSALIPSVTLRPMCTILSSLGGPKALLIPQDFVLPMRLGVTWEEQNLKGLREPSGRPKRTISCTWGRGVTFSFL